MVRLFEQSVFVFLVSMVVFSVSLYRSVSMTQQLDEVQCSPQDRGDHVLQVDSAESIAFAVHTALIVRRSLFVIPVRHTRPKTKCTVLLWPETVFWEYQRSGLTVEGVAAPPPPPPKYGVSVIVMNMSGVAHNFTVHAFPPQNINIPPSPPSVKRPLLHVL